jgi:ribosomal protein L22
MADEQDPKETAEDQPAAAKPARTRKPAAAKTEEAAAAPTAGEAEGAKPAAAKKPAAKRAKAKAKATEGAKAQDAKQAKAEGKAQDKAEAEDQPKAEEKPKARKAPARKAGAKAAKSDGEAGAKAPAAKSKPATSEKRRTTRRATVRAHARYVRTSARKARMVCGHLRGKSVSEARAILAFTPRDAARDWSKLLESAVANAENNHELLEDDLVVREAYADEGPTIKRFRPRAQGRATPIRKRTSHLTITLTPRP